MNKTRKAIIELIESYTDKSLSEGCYIMVNDINKEYIARYVSWDTDINFIWDIYITDSLDNTWDILYKDRYVNIYYNDTTELDYDLVKANYHQWFIYWHYDITAVLKYIHKMWYDINNTDDSILIWQNEMDYWFCTDFCIPNKPLHLYTEQEEKDLLELLTKLK